MKHFFRGGRELPKGRDYAPLQISRHYAAFRPVGNRNVMKRSTPEGLSEDNHINRLLRLRLLADPRNDGRIVRYNAYSLRPKAFLILFCVLFSVPDLLGTSALAQSQHRAASRIDFGDKAILGSPVFRQEADSLNKLVPLKIGDVVPDDFWTEEHLFYVNGDTVRKTLEEHKGKLLVLDFWMVGCSKCFFHQQEINYFKTLYKNELSVMMVNGMRTKNDYTSIHKFLTGGWITGLGLTSQVSIIESQYLDNLFDPSAYPTYYWINRKGILQTVTFRNLLDRGYTAPFLDN